MLMFVKTMPYVKVVLEWNIFIKLYIKLGETFIYKAVY